MDMQAIMTFINSVGFPIACCVALFYQSDKNNENYQKAIATMQNVLENNTIALKEISVKLDTMKVGE